MRTLIVTEFISLDGVVDSPGGGEHPHAGWTFKDVAFDPAAYEIKGREQTEAGAMLMGRVSYDEFAPVWPTMEEFAEYNAMPKYVVSTTLTDPAWNNTTVLGSLDEVAALKQGDGGTILVHGSPTLARTSRRPAWSTATTCWCSRSCSAAASGSSARATRPGCPWSSTRRTPTASSSTCTTWSAEPRPRGPADWSWWGVAEQNGVRGH